MRLNFGKYAVMEYVMMKKSISLAALVTPWPMRSVELILFASRALFSLSLRLCLLRPAAG